MLKKKVRLSKTDAPLRLGIHPCPTNVGTVGAPRGSLPAYRLFLPYQQAPALFFCLAAMRCM